MTDNLPLCGYCGNSAFNHELQDHNFIPVGGGSAPYHLPRDRTYKPYAPPAPPVSLRAKTILAASLLAASCLVALWWWAPK